MASDGGEGREETGIRKILRMEGGVVHFQLKWNFRVELKVRGEGGETFLMRKGGGARDSPNN